MWYILLIPIQQDFDRYSQMRLEVAQLVDFMGILRIIVEHRALKDFRETFVNLAKIKENRGPEIILKQCACTLEGGAKVRNILYGRLSIKIGIWSPKFDLCPLFCPALCAPQHLQHHTPFK